MHISTNREMLPCRETIAEACQLYKGLCIDCHISLLCFTDSVHPCDCFVLEIDYPRMSTSNRPLAILFRLSG